MHGLFLLGGAIAFLALNKKPNASITDVADNTVSPGPTPAPSPSFNTFPMMPKQKPLASGVTAPAIPQNSFYMPSLSASNPTAKGSAPPYVYEGVPSLATFGASEVESPLME